MRSRVARRRPRMLPVAGSIVLLALLAASPAAARPAGPPSVAIETHPPVLAPDGGLVGVQVIASCPDRWSVVEASVSVSQPQASGRASFPLTCFGFPRVFHVVVPASSGTFVLGTAAVTATVVVSRGKTQRATDSATLAVDPGLSVDLDGAARLEPGGSAVRLGVTVGCPVGATGVPSRIGVFQGNTSGFGSYTPVRRHAAPVRRARVERERPLRGRDRAGADVRGRDVRRPDVQRDRRRRGARARPVGARSRRKERCRGPCAARAPGTGRREGLES